jgi:hypothetical protein
VICGVYPEQGKRIKMINIKNINTMQQEIAEVIGRQSNLFKECFAECFKVLEVRNEMTEASLIRTANQIADRICQNLTAEYSARFAL